jgi:hypothetical protein
MESALEKWLGANAAATKGPWNRWDGFWLLSEGRRVHLRFRFDGVIEIALYEVRRQVESWLDGVRRVRD